MTRERDLLEKVISGDNKGDFFVSYDLYKEIYEFLAQPEEEGVYQNLLRIEDGIEAEILPSELWFDGYEAGKRSASLSKKPEQEPVAWKVIDGTNGEYMFSRVKPMERSYKYDVVIPLYTSAQKREPFEPEERQRLSKAYSTRAEQVAFEEGIIFAEISYGIGGGE